MNGGLRLGAGHDQRTDYETTAIKLDLQLDDAIRTCGTAIGEDDYQTIAQQLEIMSELSATVPVDPMRQRVIDKMYSFGGKMLIQAIRELTETGDLGPARQYVRALNSIADRLYKD